MRETPEDVREELARAADTARGLGTELGVEDMRYYGRRMDEAALPTRGEMEAYYAEEAERMRESYADILAADKAEWDAMTPAEQDAANAEFEERG